MSRNVALLVACQALLLTGAVVMVSTSALVGSRLAPDPSLATVPIFVLSIGVMVTAMPAAMLMKRIGRRWGFALGGLIGAVGGGVAAAGDMRGDFVLFCVGAAAIGAYMAFGGYYRFAAADATPPGRRGRVIGYVVGGGVFAAFAGTWLSTLTQSLYGVPEFSVAYILVGVSAALTMALALMLRVPTPTSEECARCGRPLVRIARQPDYIVALAAAGLGYLAMGLIMNSMPLAMRAVGVTFGATAFVFQWHVAAMYAPSFATGPLISRVGVTRVLALGCIAMFLCVGLNLTGSGQTSLWIALVALGLGWNLLFIGGTTLLTRTYTPEEHSKSQGLNDFAVYASIAIAAVAAGAILADWGWRAVNIAALPVIAMIVVAVAWRAWVQRGRDGAADSV
jgi:predicted MFS family arabinose efflux permease